MADNTAVKTSEYVEACEKGVEQTPAVFQRTLELTGTTTSQSAGSLEPAALNEKFPSGALICSWQGNAGKAMLIIGDSPALPDWVQNPQRDSDGENLSALAKELGELLLPPSHPIETYDCAWAAQVQEAVAPLAEAGNLEQIPLTFTTESGDIPCALIWQVNESASSSAAEDSPVAEKTAAPENDPSDGDNSLLPPYARSLMKIRVPVRVTLASTKQQVNKIVELGPGAIIQFNKSCEESLDLEVGEQHIARGEAVRVGDRFGLRITSVVGPEERFWKVPRGGRVK